MRRNSSEKMSSSISFYSTKWTLDLATRLVKANVRVHNAEAVTDEMAIVYVVNHFTRLETILLPYELYRHTGKEIWSLYDSGELHAEVKLTGRFERSVKPADLVGVMREIDDARAEEAARLARIAGV